jgi:acyl-coenzyme A synthetase/AMP-(fatty) acid ligase
MVVSGHGGSIAIRTYEAQCTYLQLQAQANRIANALVREMGLVPGTACCCAGRTTR